jgi:hypothetical protein
VAANFFKHADRDSGEVHEFDPGLTEAFLFDACFKYGNITGEAVPILGVYWSYYWLGPGADLVDVTQTKVIERARAAFLGATRGAFFAEALPMASTFKL